MTKTYILAVGVLGAAATLSSACSGDDDGGTNEQLCRSGDGATAVIGTGVGGTFEPYADQQEVPLAVAPQGGFGVVVVLETKRLAAGDNKTAAVTMDIEQGTDNLGTFSIPNVPLLCAPGFGGRMSGLVDGLDSDRFSSNDDLLDLDDAVVDLVITVIDENDNTATARTPVTLNVGN